MSKLLTLVVLTGLLAAVAYADKPAATGNADPKAIDTSAASEAKNSKRDADNEEPDDPEQIDWSQVDWRKRLTRLQYHIMREAGTERPFRNEFWDFFKPGEYRCAGCGLPLFEANAKFDSECGWPSFDRTIAKDTVTEHVDLKMLQPRTEIRCRRCDSHLGHVFNDGPTETGLRYCLNSAAMKFVSEKKLAEQSKQGKGVESAEKAEKPDKKRDESASQPVESGVAKP
jgi:methionine-R-sulfoxide reductase